jgi:cytochrome oxidase Cu insertion factor (SCO1/SenC/PrrC family)
MLRPLLVALAITLMAASCASTAPDDSHARDEAEQTPVAGQQAYVVVDGRAGYRRVPLVDVSSVELVDFASTPQGSPFATVAPSGEILLVFFGYLSCPDVCPTTIADYGRAFDLLPADLARRVGLAMVSVDPERDEGSEIADYVSAFIDRGHALLPDSGTGLEEATRVFGVDYEIEGHDAGAAHYEVGHTATVFAVDDVGSIVWEFTYPTPPADIASTLVSLFEERY